MPLCVALSLVMGTAGGALGSGLVMQQYNKEAAAQQAAEQQIQESFPQTTEPAAGTPTSSTAESGLSIKQISEMCLPSVVAITNKGEAEIRSLWGTFTQETEGSGSGVIIGKTDQELMIVTNYHVVSGSRELSVMFSYQEGGRDISDAQIADAEIKDYDSAIELVEKGLEILTGDAELDSRLDELRGEKEQYGIDSVLAKAADYASQNNYYEALEAVREGLLENAGNDRLEAALKDYSEKYKKDILARAEEAIGTDENYEAAILVFDSALNTLDGDYAQIEQAIREKREEYIQLQLEKSQRENAESAIVGTWHGVAVSSGGIDIPMDQFLEVGGMPGAAVMLGCQPSGSFHIDMFGEVGDGTWRRDEAGNGVYYLDVEGAVQQVQVDTSGRLHMDFNGVSVIFEKTEGA